MKCDQSIIKKLNLILSYELTAMDQYFIHAEMYKNWGLNKLYTRIAHEFNDEKMHAELLIKRMLFLEGVPDMITRHPLKVGSNVEQMLKNDLTVEYDVAKELREAISHCEGLCDYTTRELLQTLLRDTEEDHSRWLEQQLRHIKEMGEKNYLQTQA